MTDEKMREQYTRAHSFVRTELKSAKDCLTSHQLTTLRGQALHGDVEGARKGLLKLLGRRET